MLFHLRKTYSWHGMKKMCTDYIKNCALCNSFNNSTDEQEIAIFITNYPCELIHLDYHFLPKTSRGNKCLLIGVDHLTKKLWLKPTPEKESKYVVDLLQEISNEIGQFSKVLSDNGREFKNEAVKL